MARRGPQGEWEPILPEAATPDTFLDVDLRAECNHYYIILHRYNIDAHTMNLMIMKDL